MREHRVSVHGIGQRVRFAPFERPRGEESKALSVRLCIRPPPNTCWDAPGLLTGTPETAQLPAPTSPASPAPPPALDSRSPAQPRPAPLRPASPRPEP